MFWADRMVEEIRKTRTPRDGKRFLIRDEKTLSGRVHVGSMRGVAIHALVSEALTEAGLANEFRYELNDFDPFDSIPSYLDAEQFRPHLGKPLYAVPSPEGAALNYAEYFGNEFVSVHQKFGTFPEYYRATALYQSGRMDGLVRTALERAADIRDILKAISGSEKESRWLPVSVVCEQCGKTMTTHAYDFDGETVGYTCERTPDETVPCGHTGRVAPWKGTVKLFWKADWAAKWAVQGVDIEGGGKDHSTRGGSRDVANHISREIFAYEPPFDMPYEFFLVGGRKMSSSKGRGSSAKDMSDLFPTELYRLLLIGKDIREQIDIDPSGESVPRLYDWYDELSTGVREGKTDDYARLFAYCAPPEKRTRLTAPWVLRFRDVAFIVQMPHLSLISEAEGVKGGALTTEETHALEERAAYARYWLTTYAPEEYKYTLQETLPGVMLSLEQQKALAALCAYLADGEKTGDEIHLRLHELKTEIPITPSALFQAIYRIFLNRDSGPKAGWFLAGLPHAFVVQRLREASA